MPTGEFQISDNNTFPQGELLLNIKDLIFSGELEDNTFTINGIVPKYTNIQIASPQTNELDCFWLQDPTIILKGCYCLN